MEGLKGGRGQKVAVIDTAELLHARKSSPNMDFFHLGVQVAPSPHHFNRQVPDASLQLDMGPAPAGDPAGCRIDLI